MHRKGAKIGAQAGIIADVLPTSARMRSSAAPANLEPSSFGRSPPSSVWHDERDDLLQSNLPAYPDGLAGSQIPLLTRMVTVCDVYGALIERRSYRPPLPPIEAPLCQ